MTSATSSSPVSTACRSRPIQQPPDRNADTSTWDAAFVGDAPYVNSSNGSLDLNGISNVAEAKRLTNEWLEREGHGVALRRHTSCATGCSVASATGASRSRSSTTSTAIRTPCPTASCRWCLPETDSFSPRTFDPDDEFSNPESPLDRLEWWTNVELDLGDGPQARTGATPTSCRSGPAAAGTNCATSTRPTSNASSTPRSSGTGWGRSRRPQRTPAPWRRRPLRRRRRARRAAPAVLPVLAQGAVRPRPSVVEGAVLPAVQPGLHPGRGVTRTSARSTSRRPRSIERDGAYLLRRACRSPASGARWARA